MGEVIRKSAAADDILADVGTTLQNAKARGGDWEKLAEEYLRDVQTLGQHMSQRVIEQQGILAPLVAAIDVEDRRADFRLNGMYDEMWNLVGRPSNDAYLSILFPGGASYYVEGDTEGQPLRMELLAEVLEAKLHQKIPGDRAKAYAEEVRQMGGSLRAAVQAAKEPRARGEMYGRVKSSVARAAQMQLSNLKRIYKAKGFSERELHEVIPDRPRPASGGHSVIPAPPAAPTPPPPA